MLLHDAASNYSKKHLNKIIEFLQIVIRQILFSQVFNMVLTIIFIKY